MLDGTETSKQLTLEGLSEWTSSAEDSPVSRGPLLDAATGRATIETSGPTPSESFAEYDPDSSCWRTFQASLLTNTLEPYSGTWPRAGTMRNGTVSQQPQLVPHTFVTGSSSWPTPDAFAANGVVSLRKAAHGRHAVSLIHAVNLWPTPNVPNGGRTTWHAEQNGNTWTHQGKKVQFGLEQAARMWPTPRSSPNENRQTKRTPSQEAGSHGLSLAAEVNKWPTPTAKRTDMGSVELARHSGTDRKAQGITYQPGGQLNPTWVEWLMGFPLEWTDLKA